MIFLTINASNKVTLVHYKPFDAKYGLGKTKEELELDGLFVDSIPAPIEIDHKSPIMYFNPTTKEIFYEYEDIPKTEMEKLQDQISMVNGNQIDIQTALSQLMGM